MKYLYVCMLCVLLFSCCANKKMVVKQNKPESTWHCPKDGTCAFEIFNQKTLNILKDEFGIGSAKKLGVRVAETSLRIE